MQSLEHQRIVVTGGNSGLGLGIVEALAANGAQVVVVARNAERLAEVRGRLGVETVTGDVTDPAVADAVLRRVRPSILVLNAGATPHMAPLHEQTWDTFSAIWHTDVKAGFHWIQAALSLPLAPGSRVLIGSSGAAVGGSPLSGGYAGAKRMLWMMANYANGVSAELDRGVRFQALVPTQLFGSTPLGRSAAEAYARKKGVTVEAFLGGFGEPLTPREFGDHVARILTDPSYEEGVGFSIKGDDGIQPLKG